MNLIAQNLAFSPNTITVPAGGTLTVNFNNRDALPHNFAVYQTAAATTLIFRGDIISGPASTTYTFTRPPPGTYFFRCDVHPSLLTGTLTVSGG